MYSLLDFLQQKGKDVIPFYWLKWKPEFRTSLFPMRQIPSIEGLMGQKVFESFWIDNGYHFNAKGHTKLVHDFLGPTILEII